MKRRHETRKDANRAFREEFGFCQKDSPFGFHTTIWDLKKTFPKRKNRFFIGTKMDWLNIA